MPVSQGSAGGLPGMNLKAWVLVTAAGGIVKSFNVSSVTKGATGLYQVNFAAPMSGTDYLAKCSPYGGGGVLHAGHVNGRTTAAASCEIGFLSSGNIALVDRGALWEFYE